ncbi:putative gustatory receptor 28b [Schistocerca cancellata]|uniref:putative gustatory receptor 28b n=1 Tax=Schistocerca cancellata TaxID=274614 RepID=UPI0021178770|nr:putative gustatory receptor 28b [Schistocerca cancellata]
MVECLQTDITMNSSDLAQTVNAAYSVQNLVEVTSSFLHIALIGYMMTADLLDIGPLFVNKSKGHILFASLPWTVLSLLRLVSIVLSSEVVVQEANRTGELVDKLQLLPALTDADRRSLREFAHQLSRRSLSYDAAGLFAIDQSLLTSCVAAITTYIVILVQFGLSNGSNRQEIACNC